MKQPIAFISITRETKAFTKHGIEHDIAVRIYRNDENGHFDKAGIFHTNPVLDTQGKISAASVARAVRAQMALTRPVIDTTPVELDEDEPTLQEKFSDAMHAQDAGDYRIFKGSMTEFFDQAAARLQDTK